MRKLRGGIDFGEFDVQGFISQAGPALGECLDAAGIDWQLVDAEGEGRRFRAAAIHAMPEISLTPVATALVT